VLTGLAALLHVRLHCEVPFYIISSDSDFYSVEKTSLSFGRKTYVTGPQWEEDFVDLHGIPL
jgi:hypothetical protein